MSDKIQTKPATDAYRDGWERTFNRTCATCIDWDTDSDSGPNDLGVCDGARGGPCRGHDSCPEWWGLDAPEGEGA